MQPESYAELGRLLRNARLDAKLDFAHASRATFIRVRYLEALEEGELDRLPSPAYARGYIERYSHYLGMDTNAVMAGFDGIGELPSRRFFHIPETIRRIEHPDSRVMWGATAAAILLALIWEMTQGGGSQTASPVQPLSAEWQMKAPMLTPDCLKHDKPAWPPCYWNRPYGLTSVAPQPPTKTIMELSK